MMCTPFRTTSVMIFLCGLMLLLCSIVEAKKCSTCKSFVEGFEKGLERTKKSNFGGGNTHWEEKSLGSWATSETRLIDILDHVCDGDKDCHFLQEKYEEDLEDYWFNSFPTETESNLHTWFCIDKIKVCCPANTYGPSCKVCAGGKDRPCRGNGKCNGEGTRKGKGKCKCNAGYRGDLCEECSDGFFEQLQNDTHTECQACHMSCESTCWELGPKGCDDCKTGWRKDEEEGCVDVDECTEETPCDENKYCINTPGTYTCSDCHVACQGCTAYGSHKCVECKAGYRLVENSCTDINECDENAELCKGERQSCRNSQGSYQCNCEQGYMLDDSEETCIPEPKDIHKQPAKETSKKKKSKTQDQEKPGFLFLVLIILVFVVASSIVNWNIPIVFVLSVVLAMALYQFGTAHDKY